jgi:hypothetical protein
MASSIVDRQVRCTRLVAARTKLALDEMPVPANVATAVDQCENRHAPDAQQGSGRLPVDV